MCSKCVVCLDVRESFACGGKNADEKWLQGRLSLQRREKVDWRAVKRPKRGSRMGGRCAKTLMEKTDVEEEVKEKGVWLTLGGRGNGTRRSAQFEQRDCNVPK